MYTKTKVVSRNFIADWVAKFQNILGKNLTIYEEMVETGMQQIQDEIKAKNIRLAWYSFQITQLNNDAISITIYGEQEVEEVQHGIS